MRNVEQFNWIDVIGIDDDKVGLKCQEVPIEFIPVKGVIEGKYFIRGCFYCLEHARKIIDAEENDTADMKVYVNEFEWPVIKQRVRQAYNDKKEKEARLRAHAESASQQGNEYKAMIIELCGRMNTGEEFVQAQNEALARAQMISDSMRMKLDQREEEWSVEHTRVIYDVRQQAIRAIQTAEMHAETKARKAE